MLLVWRERSVPPALPTLPPPLTACSQGTLLQSWPQAYACLSSEDVFILLSMHGYRRARHCCHGTLASLQAAAASPTGQGSQKERWMPMQGEVGWKRPRSAESLRRAGTEEQELLQSQGWAEAAAGEIRARQPRATLCRSFPGGQGLAEGGQGAAPPPRWQPGGHLHPAPTQGGGVDWDRHVGDLSPSSCQPRHIANISPEPAIGGL